MNERVNMPLSPIIRLMRFAYSRDKKGWLETGEIGEKFAMLH